MAAFGPVQDQTSLSHKADRLAENVWTRLLARVAMAVTLPLGGWIGWQALGKLDHVAASQTEMTRSVDSLGYRVTNLEGVVKVQAPDYRAADAARDLRLRDQRDAEQDRRIGENSAAIGKIQDRLLPGLGIPR